MIITLNEPMTLQDWCALSDEQRSDCLAKCKASGRLFEEYHRIASEVAKLLRENLGSCREVLSIIVGNDNPTPMNLDGPEPNDGEDYRDLAVVVNAVANSKALEKVQNSRFFGFVVKVNVLAGKADRYRFDWRLLGLEILKLDSSEIEGWISIWKDGLDGESSFVYNSGVVRIFAGLVAHRWISSGVTAKPFIIQNRVIEVLEKYIVLTMDKCIDYEKSNLVWIKIVGDLDQQRRLMAVVS